MVQIAKKIIFKGQVQGVGFRFTAFGVAKRNQLTGYVKNLSDGSVEMLAQGEGQDVDDAIDDIQETYPNAITKIESESVTPERELDEFKITF